ncbi:MAG: GNAT family N-acetyltransferase [Pseudomonadales bacterium]|nr:GNAT family N-acetyltransferase [Pseudomonadales bacterium]
MRKIDLQPTLFGSTLRLRPLREEDFEELHRAASDPKIWELHPDSGRYKREIFRQRFFEGALACNGALAIEEIDTGKIIGSSRYYEWNPTSKEISIGYTFIERRHWGKGANQELKILMLNHIYQWASIVWFHVGKTNLRSRRAVEKLGATLPYEKERELEGKTFNQLYYKLDSSQFCA